MEENGVWRTISGRRIFIKEGQSLTDAMRESGKFDNEIQSTHSNSPFGEAYTDYTGKPEEAIEKLLVEKSGHVPAAIHKEGIGDIDFVWGKGGKDGFGLAHIIERRNNQGIDGERFVREIPILIKNGDVMRGKYKDRIFIANDKTTAIVRLDYDGEAATWLVTAYMNE